MTERLIVVDCKSVGFSIVGSNPTLFLFILMKFKAKMIQRHPFHLVDPSPWPLVAALGGLSLTFGGVLFMHNYKGGGGITLFRGYYYFICYVYLVARCYPGGVI